MLVKCCMLLSLCDVGMCNVDLEYDSEKQGSGIDLILGSLASILLFVKKGL